MDDLDMRLRKRIASYVEGEIDTAELEAWLAGQTWELEEVPAPTRRLAFGALGLVSEYSDDPDDDELRGRLGGLYRTYWFERAPKTIIPDSVSTFTRHGQWSVATDRQPVAESA